MLIILQIFKDEWHTLYYLNKIGSFFVGWFITNPETNGLGGTYSLTWDPYKEMQI